MTANSPKPQMRPANPADLAAIRWFACQLEAFALERLMGDKDCMPRIHGILATALHELSQPVHSADPRETWGAKDCEWELCHDGKCLVGCSNRDYTRSEAYGTGRKAP